MGRVNRYQKNADRKAAMEAQAARDGLRKALTCKHCGNSFTASLSKGRYPTYCTKIACQRIKRLRKASDPAVMTTARREQRLKTERERWRRNNDRQTPDELRQRVADLEQTCVQLRAELDLGPDRPPLDPSSEAVLKLADSMNGVSRPELRAAVRDLAYAEGMDQTYAQLVEVAAVATAWARRVQPSESYGELVAA